MEKSNLEDMLRGGFNPPKPLGLKRLGRPKGSVQTPKSLLLTEVRETSAVLRKSRELLHRILISVNTKLGGLPLNEQLTVAETIATITKTLSGGLESAAKHLATIEKAQPTSASGEGDVSKVLAELQK